MRRASFVFSLSLLGALGASVGVAHATPSSRGKHRPLVATPAATPAAAPYCTGDYADEPSVLLPRLREFERDPHNQYSYCLRTTAVYECLSYDSDGSVLRTRKSTVAHGTGFAYRRSGGDTYVLTNDHVASWPAVTDDQHALEDIPPGCKLVSDTVKIVDDEADDYELNDVALTRVVTDPALDVAILKTKAPLKTIPYKVGRSAALRVGNAVAAHGFPLGVFAATNSGKVVNAFDRDTEKEWDHVDFVVDALLSPGGSGSPVLAVSCRTGEYELVGIYHAGYVKGSALNVVVGIDQVRDMMNTLKRSPRVAVAGAGPLGTVDRDALAKTLGSPAGSSFFPFGPLVAQARLLPGGAIAYDVYSRGFPLHDERVLVLEDLPPRSPEQGFGEIGRVYLGGARGLRVWQSRTIDADGQAVLGRVIARLRTGATSAARFRAADESTNKGHKQRAAVERELLREASTDRDSAQGLMDLAERLGPRLGEPSVTWRDTLPASEPAEPAAPSATAAATPGPHQVADSAGIHSDEDAAQ